VLRRQFERQILAQLYINSMLKETGRKVGLAEIRDYYDKHPDEFKLPDRVKWQHIFISLGSPPNPAAAAARMEAVRQRVAAGEDFGALSVRFDEGFAGRQKGFGTGERRSGSPGNKEDWIQPPDVEATLWALKAGEVSAVIPAPTGYHLVRVLEREYVGVRPFDPKLQNEIRDKMNKALMELNEAKMVEDLWRKGVVRVVPDE
jgi:parvulin-like peptidyl-prolyl isomerase